MALQTTRLRLLAWSLAVQVVAGCGAGAGGGVVSPPSVEARDERAEIYYQVFLRSYYDSDGDGHGDFAGLSAQLDHLVALGVTTLWLNPIQSSRLYHNYFIDDFMAPDAEFGTIDDFRQLMQSAHARGLRVLIDMETQYISHDHLWFRDSFANPDSPYSHYVAYLDGDNRQPDSAIAGLSAIPGYDGAQVGITSLRLNEPEVVAAMQQIYAFWLDPDGDGDLSDGVDGFRIDHTMDDLDDKGQSVDLYHSYWLPIVSHVRAINPDVFFVAEPADWASFGGELLRQTSMDAVFDIPLMFAIRSHSADSIWSTLAVGADERPAPQQGLVLVENHDMPRLADGLAADSRWPFAAAAINLLLPAPPVIYYGQELGMRGHKVAATNDGADIPTRAAYPWLAAGDGPGMAHWYRHSGDWLAQVQANHSPAISVEQQLQQPDSLWHFYRQLTALRRSEPALWLGGMQRLPVADDRVLAFSRDHQGASRVIALINLSTQPLTVQPQWAAVDGLAADSRLLGLLNTAPDQQELPAQLALDGHQLLLWQVSPP